MNSWRSKAGWGVAAFLSLGVAIFSYRYLVGIGTLASNVMANLFARPWLYIHIAGAATALLVGPFQLLPWLRARHRRVHRWLGRIYVVGCLIGGAGGFVAAFGATAGPIATAGFGSLALIWIFVNVQGWRAALARRFPEHRAWMLRSMSLTFAAVTLRLYLPIAPLLGYSFMDGYRAASFLARVPNLILAELYLRGAFNRTRSAALVTSDAS